MNNGLDIILASSLSALLTIIGSFYLTNWRFKKQEGNDKKDSLIKACTELRQYATDYIDRIGVLQNTAIMRSGIKESMDIIFYYRKPPESMDMYDWLETNTKDALKAYFSIRLLASKEVSNTASYVIADLRNIKAAASNSSNSSSQGLKKLKELVFGFSIDPKVNDNLSLMIDQLAKDLDQFESMVQKELNTTL